MNKGSVLNLPFLGQIVKVITRDGREYEMKISEEIPDNPYLFSIMYRVSDGSGSGGYDPDTLKPNRPPPPVVRTIKPDIKQGVNKTMINSKQVMEHVMLRNVKSVLIPKEKEKEKEHEKYKPSAPVFNIPKPPEEDKKTRRRGINDIGKIVVK